MGEYKIEQKKTNSRANKENRVRGKQLTIGTLDPLTQTFVKKEFILHHIYFLGLSDTRSLSIFSTSGILQQFDLKTIFCVVVVQIDHEWLPQTQNAK